MRIVNHKYIAIIKTWLSLLLTSGALTCTVAQQTFSLPEAIDYALEHHSTIRVAELDQQNAREQYKEVKSTGMPNINGDLGYTYYYKRPVQPVVDFISPSVYGILTQEQVPLAVGPPETYETFKFSLFQRHAVNASISGEVLVFDGNFLKGLKAARLFMDFQDSQIQLTKQDIVHNVTRAYQAVLVAERNVHVIENNISNIQKLLRETQLIYENGFAEELDVDRLKVSLSNLQIEKDKLRQVIDVSYNVLKYQMAHPLMEDIRVTDRLEEVVETMIIEPEVYLENINPEKRPEHNILAQAIELDEADLERIKMGYWPSVRASASYAQSLQRDGLFNGNEAGFLPSGTIGLSARIPIYDGGMKKSQIAQKKILIEKREIELVEFDRGMHLQIINAYGNFENAKHSLNAAKESLALNQKIYDKTNIKYTEGVGSSVEVTQAESGLYAAQAQYINALYDLLTTKTELDIATGEILDK